MDIILVLLLLHFIGDFILQSDAMACNKSTKDDVLLLHASLYGVPLLIISPGYAVLNMVLHYMVDYVSSRWTSSLWKREKRHDFFVIIGLDQLIHFYCLILTYQCLIGG